MTWLNNVIGDKALADVKNEVARELVTAMAFGWEGDNFLFDPAKPAPRKTADFRAASVWFYCKPDRERKVWDTIQFGGAPGNPQIANEFWRLLGQLRGEQIGY